MDYYRVVVEIVETGKLFGARSEKTVICGSKSALGVAQAAMAEVRKTSPTAKLTRLKTYKQFESVEKIITGLTEAEKRLIETSIGGTIHCDSNDMLPVYLMNRGVFEKNRWYGYTLTPLGNEVAAALGYKAGGE